MFVYKKQKINNKQEVEENLKKKSRQKILKEKQLKKLKNLLK